MSQTASYSTLHLLQASLLHFLWLREALWLVLVCTDLAGCAAGVAQALTGLMRTNSDPDAKTIGTQLFALLVNNTAAKEHIQAALRGPSGKPAEDSATGG